MEKSKINKQNLYFSSAENNNTFVSYSLVKSNCRFCKKICFSNYDSVSHRKNKTVCLSCYVRNRLLNEQSLKKSDIGFSIFDLLILSLSENNYNINICRTKVKSSNLNKTNLSNEFRFHIMIDLNSTIFVKIDKQLNYLLDCDEFTIEREFRNSPRYSRYSLLLFYYLNINDFFDIGDSIIFFDDNEYQYFINIAIKLGKLEKNIYENISNKIDYNNLSKKKTTEIELFSSYSMFIKQNILNNNNRLYDFDVYHSKMINNLINEQLANIVNIKTDKATKEKSKIEVKTIDKIKVNTESVTESLTKSKIKNNTINIQSNSFDLFKSLSFNDTELSFSENKTFFSTKISSLEKRFAKVLNEIHQEIIEQFNIFLDIKSNISFIKNNNNVEIDFLINNKIGFELNGLRFHSMSYIDYKDKSITDDKTVKLTSISYKGISNYHFDKFIDCFKRGIKLFSLQQYDFCDENKLKQYVKNILITHLNEINKVNIYSDVDFYIKNQIVSFNVVKRFIDRCCENYFVLQNHNKHKIYQSGHYFIYNQNKIIGTLIRTNVFAGSNQLQNNCYQIVFADDFYHVYDYKIMFCISEFIKNKNILLVVNNNYQTDILSSLFEFNNRKTIEKLKYDYRELFLSIDNELISDEISSYKIIPNLVETVCYEEKCKIINLCDKNRISDLINMLKNNNKAYFKTCGYTIIY